ncbi:MAG: sigma-54 dependent transcriptional regulator [Betaproteobacteria bacterium]
MPPAPITDAPVAPPLVGESPEMKRLASTIGRIGRSDVTVLIVGESGTGKELVASRLHAASARAEGPYLALNCGAVTETLIESELFGHERGSFTGALRQHAGYFERAHGGTLFLDEVTEMPLELQVRLLRVLESRRVSRVGSSELITVDVRVIAATNRDPREAVRKGKLREDLLYRLQVVPLHVPPLRERAGDVRLLAEFFLAQLNAAGGTSKAFSESALARLERYAWPGNVRELCNVVQRAYILAESRIITHPGVDRDALPPPAPVATGEHGSIQIRVGESLADVEQRLILQTLSRCRTKDEAARILGVSTKTLYNKLRRYQTEIRAANGAKQSPAQGADARIN